MNKMGLKTHQINKTSFKKGMKPWNKGVKGREYLKHCKNNLSNLKKANDYDEILSCKNCGITYKRRNRIHYFCSISCQTRFWIKNNKKRYKDFMIQWNKENKENENIRKTEFDKCHPEIKKANSIARNIIIPKNQICIICDERLAKYKHHEDYHKPLDVVFCCANCHTRLNNIRRLNKKMGKSILKTTIKREAGKLYYCGTDKNGNIEVCEALMARRSPAKKADTKKKAKK